MAKKYQDMDIAEKIEVKKRKIKKLFKELPSDKAALSLNSPLPPSRWNASPTKSTAAN